MAVVLTAESLEQICFTYILRTLEEFGADYLALLPKDFRNRLLHSIPVVDICRLEGTQFTSGLDMKSFWKQLYKECIDPHPFSSSQQCWRERFFTTLSSTILKDDRPYGYFQVMSRAEKRTPWVGSDMTENRPVHEHPVDKVNYLVATKCEDNPTDKESHEKDEEEDDAYFQRRRYGPVHVSMKRHEVTLVKGIVPPAGVYHQACQSKQLVPPRYTKFFSEGNCFLPDSTALELINKKCNFHLKEVNISVPEFSTFLCNAEHERNNLNFLTDFFKEVESLTIHGKVEKTLKTRVIRGAKAMTLSEEIPSRLLGLILSNANPKLASLSISVSKMNDGVINSITPVLTSSYNGLKELVFRASGNVSPNLQKLISITEHQSLLHTISISIHEITQIFGSFGPVVKSTPQVSLPLLRSWIQICYKKPSLHNLRLSVSPTSSEFTLQILTMFFSTPCSHDQTLTISVNLRDDPNRSGESLSLHTKPTQNELPSDDTSASLLHQFDDTYTLQHKSIIFDNCSFSPSFTGSVLRLQPLKIKQLVINDLHYANTPIFFSQLAQRPRFDIQSLKISSMGMRGITFSDYDILLQKKSLQNLSFIHCSSIDASAIRKAAALRGFHLEEKVEPDKGIKTALKKFTYTLTRK